MTNDFTLIFSLISLGFFGGFSHCSGMCGPFVLTQVSSRLQKTSLEKFSNFQKLKNLALLPYHLGRITTYSCVGFFCSFLAKSIQDFSNFRKISAIFLLIAAAIFLKILTPSPLRGEGWGEGGIILQNFFRSKIKPIFAKKLGLVKNFLSKKISILFQHPEGWGGYFLGLILGFIPCGLLYGAFVIATSISNPIFAAGGMFLFGVSTFPSLFLTASGGYFFAKITEFKWVVKIVMLVNATALFLMAVKLWLA